MQQIFKLCDWIFLTIILPRSHSWLLYFSVYAHRFFTFDFLLKIETLLMWLLIFCTNVLARRVYCPFKPWSASTVSSRTDSIQEMNRTFTAGTSRAWNNFFNSNDQQKNGVRKWKTVYRLPWHIPLLICKCTFVFAQVVCPTLLEQDIFAFDLHDPQRINPYGFGYLLTFPLLLLPGQNLHLHTRNQTLSSWLSRTFTFMFTKGWIIWLTFLLVSPSALSLYFIFYNRAPLLVEIFQNF